MLKGLLVFIMKYIICERHLYKSQDDTNNIGLKILYLLSATTMKHQQPDYETTSSNLSQ